MDFWQTTLAVGTGAFVATLASRWVSFLISKPERTEAERDQDLLRLEKTISEIERLGVDYWFVAGDGTIPDMASDTISSKLLSAGKLVSRLFENERTLQKAVDIKLNRLDVKITSGSFGGTARDAEPIRKVSIEDAAISLTDQAIRCRRKLKRKFLRS